MKDCGVLLHVSSLPSPYGIGSLGREAYAFADFLHDAGQSYWQILPVNPTSYGDSPYQSPSAFAGNPYFIDLDALRAQGLLTQEETDGARFPQGRVDYGAMFATRLPLLRKAFARFDTQNADYLSFCRQNEAWLSPYALFSALKDAFGLRPHWEWDEAYRAPDTPAVRAFAQSHAQETDFYRFLQYVFDAQWKALKAYVNARGIRLIGDMPIYVAYDSADFWENKRLFAVDENGKPSSVAGVPPDYFSADGQLWGNPLYDWEYMKADGYRFWVDRIRRTTTLFDRVRIDHFRGFCAYYAVPASAETAREGTWREGPGMDLFDALHAALGDADIIAEDLGVDAPELRALLNDCGYPGMKVVQFGFDGHETNAHFYKNYPLHCVGYTGTHDNDTALGWFSSLSCEEQKRVKALLPRGGDVAETTIRALFRSKARTAIVPMQDWLRQGSEARMNIPGTREGNWQYRLPALPSHALQEEMLALARKYKRERKD